MRMHIAAALGMATLVTQANAAAGVRSEVVRTTHGIVHVKANDYRSLGYGTAYAYAQDNVCMLADTLLTVRGERSRYFGGEAPATQPKNGEYGAAMDTFYKLRNEDSDFFFKGYLDLDQLRAGYAAGSADVRELLAGYADGYNRFLGDKHNVLPKACRGAAWVKPISVDDVYLLIAEKSLHASGEAFAGAIVAASRDPSAPPPALGDAMPAATQPLPTGMKAGVGSNAIALGSEATANGRGLLLGNPHYPWTSTDRFYQLHLTIPGKYDAMGASLGGLPMVSIGFNKDVAWTHTVTAARHFTTFVLTLDPSDPTGTTYVHDGAPVKMSERHVSVDVLQADGTVAKKERVFYFSRHGAVIVMPQAGVDWTRQSAFVLADANRLNTRLPEQWLAIGKADSVEALQRSANAIVGLPWVNTIAADSHGSALFLDASAVPHVAPERFASDCMVVPSLLGFDGSRSECEWGQDADAPKGLFGAANMPGMIRKDYVENSNDNYWLANAKAPLTGPAPYGYSPLYGQPGTLQSLRTRIGLRQIEAALADGRSLRADDLQGLLFNNRVYAAELVLPELLKGCYKAHDLQLLAPCAVLSTWDRRANVDSRGAVLFREFWNTARSLPGLWSVPFNPADPVNTPRGVSAAAMPALLDALRGATDKLQALGVPLYGRLGDYQTQTRNGRRIGLHGGQGDEDGVFNVVTMATDLTSAGYRDVAWGTSYVQLVGFDHAGPVAKGLLTYGQSVDPQSPYYADQLSLFTQKSLVTLPFTEAQIRADRNYTRMVLAEK
jgi:acyl-homoserine-lactone acylase